MKSFSTSQVEKKTPRKTMGIIFDFEGRKIISSVENGLTIVTGFEREMKNLGHRYGFFEATIFEAKSSRADWV